MRLKLGLIVAGRTGSFRSLANACADDAGGVTGLDPTEVEGMTPLFAEPWFEGWRDCNSLGGETW